MVDLIRLGPTVHLPLSQVTLEEPPGSSGPAQSQRVLILPATHPGPNLAHLLAGARPDICSPRWPGGGVTAPDSSKNPQPPSCCHWHGAPGLTSPSSAPPPPRAAPQRPLCPFLPLNAPPTFLPIQIRLPFNCLLKHHHLQEAFPDCPFPSRKVLLSGNCGGTIGTGSVGHAACQNLQPRVDSGP